MENREILFKGKRVDNGEWVEGFYLVLPMGETVILSNKGYVKVIPETVVQYVGLKDKNGKKIFEGDIVSIFCVQNITVCIVKWEDCGYIIQNKDKDYKFSLKTFELEVIGNIHDNKEDLEVE